MHAWQDVADVVADQLHTALGVEVEVSVLRGHQEYRYVSGQAMALFLVAPKVLYAVNRHVDFVPCAISFELAETPLRPGRWSLE